MENVGVAQKELMGFDTLVVNPVSCRDPFTLTEIPLSHLSSKSFLKSRINTKLFRQMQVDFSLLIFKHDLLCGPIHRARQHFRSNLPRSFQPGPHFSLCSSCPFLSLSHIGLPIPFPWHKGFHSYKIV